MDVARKVVILAREAGLRTELADVAVQSLVPAPLAGAASAEEFLAQLPRVLLLPASCNLPHLCQGCLLSPSGAYVKWQAQFKLSVHAKGKARCFVVRSKPCGPSAV
jgi:hypothetical protein